MKTLRLTAAFLVLAALTGCAGAPLGPVDIRPQTPNLNIEASKKLPLTLAVVVSEPMGYTIMYYGAGYKEGMENAKNLKGGYFRDMTSGFHDAGFYLEREMSKAASETFSQAFNQVVVLRELPQPGQYDAVVQLNIPKISLHERVNITGESCDVTTQWSMSLLDGQNREILGKKGVSPAQNFTWSIFTPGRDFLNAMGPIMSKTVTDMTKEWAETLYGSEALRTLTPKPETKP
ncbi:MAG: hypothetical protein HZB82_04830 [Deltaproteobacteria bacterium]|nr:hypothetical protein [Deltaproteobacteria bacterium]